MYLITFSTSGGGDSFFAHMYVENRITSSPLIFSLTATWSVVVNCASSQHLFASCLCSIIAALGFVCPFL